MLKSQEFNLNFSTLMSYSTFLSNFSSKCMASRVRGFELGVQGTWFREYMVHNFEGTG